MSALLVHSSQFTVHRKIRNTTKGFTLVELLVVITILAILSTVGLTVFGGVQKSSRDSKRKADINSIANVLEMNYNDQYKSYVPVTTSQFVSGVIPTDPGGRSYCLFWWRSGETPDVYPTTAWPNTTCPSGTHWGGGTLSGSRPYSPLESTYTTAGWNMCASLEDNTVYCMHNSQ